MENNDYSALYADKETEAADPHADAYNDYLERELVRKGKLKTTVLGVLMLIGTGINFLRTFPDLEKGIAYWLGEVLFIALCAAVIVMYMKGKNYARIIIGVFYCIALAISLVTTVAATAVTASYGSAVIIVSLTATLFAAAFIGVFIWFTLIDKSVKAYCLSTKTERGTDNGRT